jgi:hypothetical protein
MKKKYFTTSELAQKTRRAARIVRARLQRLRDKYNNKAFDDAWLADELVFKAMNYPVHYAERVKDENSLTGSKMKIDRYGAAQTIRAILGITEFCESSILANR